MAKCVEGHAAIEVENTALYLQLAIAVVSRWKSTSLEDEVEIPGGVRNLINMIFDQLEINYGARQRSEVLDFRLPYRTFRLH